MSGGRQSISTTVSLEGVGLHLGERCTLTFRPADSGTGIVFRRVDLPDAPRIAATVENAVLSERRTQLGKGERAIHTVEHVLAALVARQVDDVLVDVSGPEPPILDGSARPFFDALGEAGIAERPEAAQYLDVRAPIDLTNGVSVYHVYPAPTFSVKVTIDFPHALIGRQTCDLAITPESFGRELASARTFGFMDEVDALREKGLIKGASTDNAVVLDANGPVGTTLRWPDEFVRHKTMDCIGDLALAGQRVRARIVADKPSHRGTVTLVRRLVQLATKETRMLEIEDILRVLPHRYPILLVDRILELEPRTRIVGLKNVTINEPFFQGHFPGHPIMPGVLIIEAMAQVGGMLLMGQVEDPDSKVVYFMSLDNVKWRRPVRPGDQLRSEVVVQQIRGRVCKMHGRAFVGDDVVCEADMGAMVMDK